MLAMRRTSTRAGLTPSGRKAVAWALFRQVEPRPQGGTEACREIDSDAGQNKASLSALKTDRHALGRPLSTDENRTKPQGMPWPTCSRVQPRDGYALDGLTPFRPLAGGARSSCYSKISCYSMRTTARWRHGPKLCPSLPACSSAEIRSADEARRRTVMRCRLPGASAPLACAEWARCDDSAHSCCGCWRSGKHSRGVRALRRTRATSPMLRLRTARERGLTHEVRWRLRPASSHVARLMRTCRLLPRSQVVEDSPSKSSARGEEPPLPASRAARGAEAPHVLMRQESRPRSTLALTPTRPGCLGNRSDAGLVISTAGGNNHDRSDEYAVRSDRERELRGEFQMSSSNKCRGPSGAESLLAESTNRDDGLKLKMSVPSGGEGLEHLVASAELIRRILEPMVHALVERVVERMWVRSILGDAIGVPINIAAEVLRCKESKIYGNRSPDWLG